MKKKAYHHGHLRNAMIESGIRLLNSNGMEGFSLRKVASRCGVSSSAPYTYFSGKKELLHAMENHVNAKLLWRLFPILRTFPKTASKEQLMQLSLSYITFFLENPHYFDFLFHTCKTRLPLSLSEALTGRRSPFLRLYQSCCRALEASGCPRELQELRILSYLSTIHGIISFSTTPGFVYHKSWQAQLPYLITPALELLLAPAMIPTEAFFLCPGINPHPQSLLTVP